AAGADTLVLGCTHYPFLRPLISGRAGAQVAIIDPAGAVARQVVALTGETVASGGRGSLRLLTTGHPGQTRHTVRELTGIDRPVIAVTLAEE
ncbi:MAG TPA: glutamate racemase, partial [Acidimicrobiia bacterium]|nr:glutamate racemase [Acidimicrobiia bacterium]